MQFNENREKSESFSIAAMIEMTEGKFQHIDLSAGLYLKKRESKLTKGTSKMSGLVLH